MDSPTIACSQRPSAVAAEAGVRPLRVTQDVRAWLYEHVSDAVSLICMTPKFIITVRHERSADFAATEAMVTAAFAHNARVTSFICHKLIHKASYRKSALDCPCPISNAQKLHA